MDPAVTRRFILDLAVALHQAGTPAHQLESALAAVARRLGVDAQLFTTPTQIVAAFGPRGDQHVAMERVEPGEIDLGKLGALDQLADAVVAGELGIEDGVRRIEQVVAAPPRYGRAISVAAYALLSASAALFLRGSAYDMSVAGVIGVVIGALSLAFARTTATSRVFELIASFAAAAIAGMVGRSWLPISSQVTTLAGLIALVPGLTLTVALNELATRNLVSGTARLTAAAIVFLQIAFGVALAEQVVAHLWGPTVALAVAAPPAIPAWAEPIALVVAILSSMALFRAHPRAAVGIFIAGFAAYYGARIGAYGFGPVLGASVGGFLVTAGSNVYARVARRPAMISLVPGILLLVPGSLGFQSVSSMLRRDTITGIDTAFTMILVAVSLVAGMLVANFTISPRRSL